MEFAETNSIDLLVVLPKQHSLIEKLLFKSHVRQFVLHSHIPVMALHE
jgi:nucleotide-binding universal stress UspA family protein